MGKILSGLSDESVWLKSLAEHDNVDKIVQLTCSASDFNHTLSSQIPFILHHKNSMCTLCPKEKRYTVKVYSFQENWGMADIVDSLLKDLPSEAYHVYQAFDDDSWAPRLWKPLIVNTSALYRQNTFLKLLPRKCVCIIEIANCPNFSKL